MATTSSLWSMSDKWGTKSGTRYYACPLSTLESALNNTAYVPANAWITDLRVRVTADIDVAGLANVYFRYGIGSSDSINKALIGEYKFPGFDTYEIPEGGASIKAFLNAVKAPFSFRRDYGDYLTFYFKTSNILSKTFFIKSVILEITYEIHNHSYTIFVSETPATCLASGSRTKRCSCEATTTETLARLSHSYTGAIKNDSNGKTGTHSYKCVNGCNQYGGAKTHTWDSGTQTTAPTCTADGVKTFTCTASGCGGTYTESIPKLGHSWGNPTYTWSADGKTCTAKRVCGRCGTTETATATITSKVTDATCTAKGETTYTATFGVSWATTQTKVIEIPAKGHTQVTIPAVAPTCESTGLTAGVKCSVCGTIITAQQTVAKLGHNYEGKVTKEPTCTEKGVKTFTCKNDTSHYYTEEIEALGHIYAEVTTPPTETERGYTTHTCSRCGHSYIDSYTHKIIVKSNNDSYGTVTGGGDYAYGKTVTLTATANSGYKFVKWSDGVTDNPRVIEITGNRTYTATFEKLPPEFTSASMTYLNKQISASNKVIHNEGFIISVGVK